MVGRNNGPVVIQNLDRRAAHIDHRLDCQSHSSLELGRGTGGPIIRDLRFLVKVASDAVTHELLDHTKSVRFHFVLDRRADLVQAAAFTGFPNPFASAHLRSQ